MTARLRKTALCVALIGAALWLHCLPAFAQTAGRITLLPPNLTRFPFVSFAMEADDPGGKAFTDLSTHNVLILENDTPRPADAVKRLPGGLHLVAAFNTAPALGTAALEQVRKSLLEWCARQPASGLNEFSLVSNSGGQSTKLSRPADWSAALRDFTPDLAKGQPSLVSLTQAFDLVTDAGRRSTSKRAVLWITPPLPDASLPALPNLAERANQLGTRLFVWLVLPPGSLESKTTTAMQDLAQRTGGQLAVLNGSQPIPNPEAWLEPLRYIYQVEYTSAVRQSGAHRLQVIINRGEGQLISSEQRFNLTLLPPNPIFLSPPVSIQRVWVDSGSGQPVLHPQQVTLPILIEFPDALNRPLTAARLYVDGNLASHSTDPAPAALTWALEQITSSGRHALRVEVEDVLGFKRTSIEIPIEVEIQTTPSTQSGFDLSFFTLSSKSITAGGLVLASLAVVLLGVGIWQRLRPKPAARRNRPWEVPHLLAPNLAAQRALRLQDAPARLVRLTEEGQPLPANNIPVPHRDLLLGSDPKKAALLVESASVDGVHARITPQGEDEYRLSDAGSLAGTWVNYAPVSQEGVLLRHGDRVQLGRETFCFELTQPRQVFQLHIQKPEKDAQA